MMMIRPLLSSIFLSRPVVLTTTKAAAAAAATCCCACAVVLFAQLDCNPALFWRHYRLHGSSSNHKSNKQQQQYDCLKDKCIWIIGASSGIGEELAYQLSAHGSRRLILSSRSGDKLEQVAAQCRRHRHGPDSDSDSDRKNLQEGPPRQVLVDVIPMDVTDYSSLQSAVQRVASSLKTGGGNDDFSDSVDIVILNAGRGHLSPALETDASTARQVLEQTAIWPMLLTPLLMPLYHKKKKPHLVVTSSIAALLPVPLSSVYAASKHALHGYFLSLQAEDPNLRIDLICPGPVDTNFHHEREVGRHPQLPTTTSATTTDDADTDTNTNNSHHPMKLSTRRCAELMVTTLTWPSNDGGREVWICSQPTLFFLYLNKWLPQSLTRHFFLKKVGSRRVAMWRQGWDLYDPALWRKPLPPKVEKVTSRPLPPPPQPLVPVPVPAEEELIKQHRDTDGRR